MAELEGQAKRAASPASGGRPARWSCCDGEGAQAGPDAAHSSREEVPPVDEMGEAVRRKYAAVARRADAEAGCCSAAGAGLEDERGEQVFGASLYGQEAADPGTAAAIEASLGCGVPTAVADLHQGEVVLDLGSGAGADVLISARRVAPRGRAIGLDMTDEMLELARENARRASIENVEFLKGFLEDIPLPSASVDVVISNCVINLSAQKERVIREAARVLRPGGRFAVSDVVADDDLDPADVAHLASCTGCIAGALTERQFIQILTSAGLERIKVTRTHRVHQHASAAIIQAVKPSARKRAPRQREMQRRV